MDTQTNTLMVTKTGEKLEKLNELQLAKMEEIKSFWLNYIFSCKNTTIDKDKADKAIEWLYKLAGYTKPIIVYVDSPMSCQIATNFIKNLPLDISRDQVGDQVRDQVGDQVRDQVRAQVWDQVRDQVGAQVWAQVWDQVGAQVRDQVGDQHMQYNSFASYGSITDYGWVSFYDFFTTIGVLEHSNFLEFKNIFMSGIYDMIQLNGFCIVSKLPSKIVRNASGRLHNPNGPAIEFTDGYCQYYINGRALPSWIWEKAAQGVITKEMFLSEKNAEIKGGIYEVLGQKKMMELLGAEEVDTQTITHNVLILDDPGGMQSHTEKQKETVTLLKTKERFEEIGNQPFAWVKMVCPSTGTNYLVGVEPHHTNALEAIASLSMFNSKDYSFDMRS